MEVCARSPAKRDRALLRVIAFERHLFGNSEVVQFQCVPVDMWNRSASR